MKTIAFHSYKGGTGKTTLAVNLSAHLASKGYNVLLIDMDVYAPSLYVYFNIQPKKWINDYLNEKISFAESIYDFTHILKEFSLKDKINNQYGSLHAIFSNPSKQEITDLDSFTRKELSKSQSLKKMLYIKETKNTETDYDYIILDTSPGIRYWSINSLAISDEIILSLKMDNIDIEGTKHMALDVYGAFTSYGSKSYLLLNRVAGYCEPSPDLNTPSSNHEMNSPFKSILNEQIETIKSLERLLKMDVIASVPCYCDIQFEKQEYLTVLSSPNHPFTRKINELSNMIQ
ncbi:MAG TPA: ParA family protein [Candidatus Nitrosocosmicus sp.]|nr:ParA family protein [Candidatus Nitrosocosmicus sp.]